MKFIKLLLRTTPKKIFLLTTLLFLIGFGLIKDNPRIIFPTALAGCQCNSCGSKCGPDPQCGCVNCLTGQDYSNVGCAPVNPTSNPNAEACHVTGYSGGCFTVGPSGCRGTIGITTFEGPGCPTTTYQTSSGQGGAGTYCPSPGHTCGRNCNQVDNPAGGVCKCAPSDCGPTSTPKPTPTKVPCDGPCTSPDQCVIACPVCTAGGKCMAPSPTPTPIPCNQPCTGPGNQPNEDCVINCPICAPGPNGSNVCLAPTATPIPCNQPCTGPGNQPNEDCVINCPICAPGPNGNNVCLAPTPTPIPCGQPCSGPKDQPFAQCEMRCPICASGPNGNNVCLAPTATPTPICGV